MIMAYARCHSSLKLPFHFILMHCKFLHTTSAGLDTELGTNDWLNQHQKLLNSRNHLK